MSDADLFHVNVCQFLHQEALFNRQKVSTLVQSVSGDPYCIESSQCPGNLGNQVHCDVFLFPYGNL